jgi:hypothetical protein
MVDPNEVRSWARLPGQVLTWPFLPFRKVSTERRPCRTPRYRSFLTTGLDPTKVTITSDSPGFWWQSLLALGAGDGGRILVGSDPIRERIESYPSPY